MERLTKRLEDGQAIFHECHGTCGTCDGANCYCIGHMVDRLAVYEDTGMEPEEINDMALEVATLKTIESMYDGFGKPDHIRDLLQAEQDGRLGVLPCKVGDRVFHVRRVTQAEAKRMGAPTRHRGIVYYEDRPFAIKEKLCTKSDYAQIGKTVFLTREEAEAALALKGGES